MKSITAVLIFALALISCKSEKSEPSDLASTETLSIAEYIANAHGYNNWKKVSEVTFTFKVDRDSVKGKGRQWVWHPKTDSIRLNTGTQVIKYKRSHMDSTHIAADRAFINDKFWLFVPFQLVWDSAAAEISEPKMTQAPISGKALNMITITYPDNAGGYTPGDAYDIYFDQSYVIQEWSYRKGNSPEPTLSTTFENYQEFNDIKIAIDHKMPDTNWNLNFSDVSITFE
jgi:hypothetical protein